MFDALARPLSSLLAFFYQLVPSYAGSIVLLTVAVMVFLTPFTVKSTRSMLAMQRLQPEIKKLQQQHKNDRQALNEAMMAFYKEHNVNPLGGCLPMLLQMPVFIGLYQAIRGITANPPRKSLGRSTDLFKAVCPKFNGTFCNGAKDFQVQLKSFGMDLARSVSEPHGSLAKALPFYLLIALTTGTQYYQQRQLSNRNPQAAAANPQMQTMQKFFPIIFLFIYIRIPAAVVVYFLISNLLRIAQQGAMWRWDPKLIAEVGSEVNEIEAKTKAIDAKATPTAPKLGKGDKDKTGKPEKGKPQQPVKGGGNGTKGRPTPKAGAPKAANGGKPMPSARGDGGKGNGSGSTGAGPAGRQRGRARKGR